MHKKFWTVVEIILVATVLPIHGMWYNFVGQIAALRHVDYGPDIRLALDAQYPLIPYFSLVYVFVWVYPVFMLIYLAIKVWPRYTLFRRIYVGFLAMMILAYIFWIVFPNCVGARASQSLLDSYGWSGQLTWFIYNSATIWNGFPSFHIAVVWYTFRIFQIYCKPGQWIALLMVILTMISVLVIRIHYLIDIIGGLILAELVIQAVVKPLEKRKICETSSHAFWITLYVAIAIFMISLKYLIAGLLNISG